MKVKFITSNLAPFRIDWLDELAIKDEITIFYNQDDVKDVNQIYLKRKPQRAKYKKITKKILGIEVYSFREILKTESDLIILDGYGFISQIILMNLLRLKKIPFILSVDGGFINKQENKVKYGVKKYIIKSATGFLSTSKFTDEYLIHYGANKEKIKRHYFTSIYNNDVKEKINSNRVKETIQIIAVGKFIYGKGFDILLRAMKRVDSNVKLKIIGGKETAEYTEIIKENKLKNIEFIDFCEKEELIRHYDESDIFVLPTRSEVWGLVINEAMSRGLPVITTEMCIAGLSLIENNKNGYIIPVDNESELLEKINILARDKELRVKFGSENLKKIKEYTIERSTEKDFKVFREFVNEKY